ncbi:hypothetical protein SAMN05660964_01712 [Thiothrix caldifontis]|uniref:Uncharacterized protein n=1 Tax=Thiothrix caldifontis TaxID=525918 RepID=A0A1H4BLT7_9GAMM|nr:hypothetical protein [Thiothrix caldifontis]SEA49067.1 hypothetical protein SAMN05660964_01712 [Thiothrix caldifontis]
MKKHIIGIATLIGFIIGLGASFALMFGGWASAGLYNLSLGFVVDALPLPGESGWVVAPLFFVAVYTLYGAAFGFLIKKFGRSS